MRSCRVSDGHRAAACGFLCLWQAVFFLLPMLAEFMRLYSDIELDLDFSNKNVDLIEEGFDLAIRVGDLHDFRLMARKCGAFRLILVAAPDYLSEKGIPKAVSDLSRHDCLHFRYMRSGKIAKWPLPEDADTSDTRLPARLIANENLMLIQAARSGLGIARVPTSPSCIIWSSAN